MMTGIVLSAMLSASGAQPAPVAQPAAGAKADGGMRPAPGTPPAVALQPIVARWGTRDTALSPRQHFRVWVKLGLAVDSGSITLPTTAADPRLYLAVGGREIEVPGDLSFGKATSLDLRPGFSHFAYAVSHLWGVSGSLAPVPTPASLKLRFADPRIRVEPDSLPIQLVPVDNPAIEHWFTRHDSLSARLRRAGWNGLPTPKFCEQLGPAFDSLDRSGKLTGALAGSAIFRSMQMCHEEPESRDFVLTPAWSEFTEFQLCHYRAMREKQNPNARCSTQVEALNGSTRRLLGARSVVSRGKTHFLVTPRDTVAVPFPHYR